MAQINVANLTFCYDNGFENVFENVSFHIDTDWKLGFIGRNGKGKTTFLNLLLGKYTYQGTISTSTLFDYFPFCLTERQMKQPASEFAEEIKTDCQLWRVICELEQLGEGADILYRPFHTLSYGERTKVLLAVLFSGEHDFLLIDEPTNHLDEAARESVKGYLSAKKGFILVSHDRELLDACIDHVLVLNRKTIEVQAGNFSSWWENKRRRDQFMRTENEKHQKEIGKLKQAASQTARWADKNERSKIGFDPVKEHDRSISSRPYIGAKTKKMQSRVKQMEKRLDREIEEKEGLLADIEETAELKLMPLRHHKEVLVNVRDYGVWYPGAENPVFSDLTFTLRRGERIALHGENGCGKSTLMKMILQKAKAGNPNAGNVDGRERVETAKTTENAETEIDRTAENAETEIDRTAENAETEIDRTAEITETGIYKTSEIAETGICETASGLVISYVSQDTSGIKGTISEFCMKRGLEEKLFCAILRQLDLERSHFLKDMEDYSEGQKKKVLLAASLLTPAHLYLWDEPLNYIDVFSRMQLEKVLLEYGPTMLFVEHDKRFRERVATKQIEW